jgi:hypothetical protein
MTPVHALEPVDTVFGPFLRDNAQILADAVRYHLVGDEDMSAYATPGGLIIPGEVIHQ